MRRSHTRNPGRTTGYRLSVLLVASVLGLCSIDSGESCTSFVLDNGGHPLFGTNYDNSIWPGLLFVTKRGVRKAGLSAGIDGQPTRWTSRFASVTFNVGGYQLPWAGMNDQGLVLSTMALSGTSPPPADARTPLDYGPLWMQYVLDTCRTVEDVIAADAKVRIVSTVDHYLVADRTGATAVLELLDGEMVVHTGGDLVVKVLTNSEYPVSAGAWLTFRGQGGYAWLPDAERRFCLAADRVDAFEPTTAEAAVAEAFEVLQLVADPPYTRWSIVFDMRALRAHFRTFENPRVRTVDLLAFDPRCQEPDQMLDVHAPLAGDVTDELLDRSYQRCYDHTLQYLTTTGQLDQVSPEALRRMLDQVFAAPCIDCRRASARRR